MAYASQLFIKFIWKISAVFSTDYASLYQHYTSSVLYTNKVPKTNINKEICEMKCETILEGWIVILGKKENAWRETKIISGEQK